MLMQNSPSSSPEEGDSTTADTPSLSGSEMHAEGQKALEQMASSLQGKNADDSEEGSVSAEISEEAEGYVIRHQDVGKHLSQLAYEITTKDTPPLTEQQEADMHALLISPGYVAVSYTHLTLPTIYSV